MCGWLSRPGIGRPPRPGRRLRDPPREAARPPPPTRAFEEGWSFIDAIQWWGARRHVWRAGGRARIQPAVVDLGQRSAPYPFEDDAAFFLAEFDGPLAELSPRAQLARMVERAAAAGLEAEVGWEFECIVLEPTPPDGPAMPDGRRTPAMPANRCWSALTMAAEADDHRRPGRRARRRDVPVDHVCAELGPGCLELATAHRAGAVRSADDAALAKLYTKAYFARRGRTATFMAQLGEASPGWVAIRACRCAPLATGARS